MTEYYYAIDWMRTHRKGEPVAKDKPLLLLLAISKVMQGKRNFFVFEEIETEYTDLLLRFGDLEGRSLSPHASFVDLAGQVLLWDCSLHRTSLEDPDDLTRSKVLPHYGNLQHEFWAYLIKGRNAGHVMGYLLHKYWEPTWHGDILQALGVEGLSQELHDAGLYAEYRTRDPQCILNDFGIVPSEKILYRDDYFWVLEDAHPLSPGHCLVITLTYRRDYWELSPEEHRLLPFVLREARRIIDDRYQPDAYHIEMNCGEAAGQSIPHFHCHLIPRYQGDSIQAQGGSDHVLPGLGDWTLPSLN